MDQKRHAMTRFREDCKKLGIKEFDFENENGPWRILYLLHANKRKPGRTHDIERVIKLGSMVENLIHAEHDRKAKDRKYKRKLNSTIYVEVCKAIKVMRETGKVVDEVFDFPCTEDALRKIHLSYGGLLKSAKLAAEKLDYYSPRYKSKKLK